MKHGPSIAYTFGLVAMISLVVIGIGIRQKKRGDIIVGMLIMILCLISCLLEFL